jgi:hypothetical protein
MGYPITFDDLATQYFTAAEVARIGQTLGRGATLASLINVSAALGEIVDPARHDVVIGILDALDTLDTQIATAVIQANVRVVGEITLLPMEYVKGLKQEASRQLNQLAQLTNCKILYNKYTQNSTVNPGFIRSYQ